MDPVQLTCIVCPMGCSITVSGEPGALVIQGNSCPRGAKYAEQEVTRPVRVVTSTVTLVGGDLPLCPCKTSEAIPKAIIPQCLAALRGVSATAPVHVGQTLAEFDIEGTRVTLLATAERKAVKPL